MGEPVLKGIVILKREGSTTTGAMFLVVHRAEIRAAVLDGNEVSWSTSTNGEYETEFDSTVVAALFFNDLTENDEDATWEGSDGDEDTELWIRNGQPVPRQM